MEQVVLPFKKEVPPLRPHPERLTPALWISRVLLLRGPRIGEDTVIRDIRMRPGLNILWAQPSPTPLEPNKPPGKVTGHSAGKTTFCRMIRYLLGESRFGTPRLQERIRAALPDGWIVGEVFVRGEPWVICRPFARWEHRFATRGVSAEEGLVSRGPYQDFLAALEDAVTRPLPVQILPNAGSRIDWAHLLPWIARDQEARFAAVADWRAPASESESPNPSVADRHVVARAVLDLMSTEESDLEQESKVLVERRRVVEEDAPDLRARASENRGRLAARLDLSSNEADSEPLFIEQLRNEVRKRREVLEREYSSLAGRRAEVSQAEQAWATASQTVKSLRETLGRLKQRREELQQYIRQVDSREAAATQRSLLASLSAPPGRCNVTLEEARAKGCQLAVSAPVSLDASRGRREVMADSDEVRRQLAATEEELAVAQQNVDNAAAEESVCKSAFFRLNTALANEQGRLDRERGALGEIEQQFEWTKGSHERLESNSQEKAKLDLELRKIQKQKTQRRQSHEDARGRLSSRFEDVVQSLLGTGFGGRVDVEDGKLVPQLVGRTDLQGAAMDTLAVLAFDLTALTLGLEGFGWFPSFLIHDGPREADLDPSIYAQLFRHVAQLEHSYSGPAGFQYIVTTTSAPPAELQRSPWLLDTKLDASVAEGRLLKLDL